MKKINLIAPIAVIILAVSLGLHFRNQGNELTEYEAVFIVKNAYQKYDNYPNENLSPQSIRTEKEPNGWYVAFVQEGSGRPIIGAQCYFVNKKREISYLGEFKSSSNETNFSLKDCR